MINIRDSDGKLLMRYDPGQDVIEIQRRGIKTSIDLRQYKEIAMSDSVIDESKRPTRKQIEDLSRTSVAVHNALMYCREYSPNGHLSFEETLIFMVTTLNMMLDNLEDSYREYMLNNPYPDKSATSATAQGGANGRQSNT